MDSTGCCNQTHPQHPLQAGARITKQPERHTHETITEKYCSNSAINEHGSLWQPHEFHLLSKQRWRMINSGSFQ
jgi:hypothetical protein